MRLSSLLGSDAGGGLEAVEAQAHFCCSLVINAPGLQPDSGRKLSACWGYAPPDATSVPLGEILCRILGTLLADAVQLWCLVDRVSWEMCL